MATTLQYTVVYVKSEQGGVGVEPSKIEEALNQYV